MKIYTVKMKLNRFFALHFFFANELYRPLDVETYEVCLCEAECLCYPVNTAFRVFVLTKQSQNVDPSYKTDIEVSY